MGQHKYNKVATDAREGKIQPKVKEKHLNPRKLKTYLKYEMMGLTPEQYLGVMKFNKEYVEFVKQQVAKYKEEHPDEFKEPTLEETVSKEEDIDGETMSTV